MNTAGNFSSQSIPSNVSPLRKKTLSKLISEGIPFLDTLPDISIKSEKIRNKDDILKRAIAVTVSSAKAFGCPEELISKIKEQYKDVISFSKNEKDFLDDLTPDNAINIGWKIEAGKMLFWALGLINDHGSCTEEADINTFWNIIAKSSFEELNNKAKLRNKEEILELLDYIYNVHWALVEVRLGNIKLPTQFKGTSVRDIVPGWHHGLNWITLYCDQDWDEVTTDT